jgi:DNA helicase IV
VIPKSAELAEEQQYFDTAQKHRERIKGEAGAAPTAAANSGAARWLARWARRRTEAIGPAEEAVAWGRADDESGEPLYIGRQLITDDDRRVLVVNWQAPAAAPYYQATPADPRGLVRKRTFECDGNAILDFQDVVFKQLTSDLEELYFDRALLVELERSRDGAMRDIAATIHAAQYELIRSSLDQLLVIEGGPGTGKTAVALHRVSWLLFNHRDRLTATDVLVVGPHPAFTRYIRTVLPDLGDTSVDQVDIGMLAPAVRRGRIEPPGVRRLKGDARMSGLLARALDARVGTPEPAERLLIDGRFVTLSAADVAAELTATREAALPYAGRRQLLRERLLQLVRDRGASLERERFGPVDSLVERLWPQLTAAAFLRDLLGSRARLTAAAGHEFTAGEAGLLHRRGADRLSNEVWSAADLPLLDEAEQLINGPPRRYAHIVVDEAQDLSPMQLRSVARRSSTGSLTVVGDLAQSTGAWARDGWDEVTRHLPATLPHARSSLRYGYRVPRQVYEFAARLLPVAAPAVQPTQVVRDGPAEPGVHRVEPGARAAHAVALTVEHAAAGRFVGLICPATCRSDVEAVLTDQGEPAEPVVLVSPHEAKGLEFDAVVVVEPADIVAEDERGHRLLYMALTRTTRYLDIVCTGEPLPLAADRPVRQRPRPRPRTGGEPADVERLAGQVAALVRGGAPAPLWLEVLQRAAELLAPDDDSAGRHRR